MKKTKDSIIFMIILMSIILITPTISQAALQSNGNTSAKYNINEWIWKVREMQGAGGTLGLTDSIDWDKEGGKYLTSNNPNLDIHMEKNTEFGAMAILSASSYGNPNPIGNGETTTGNITGVVINFDNEWVAAGQITSATTYAVATSRYKDNYTTNYVAKAGDAIEETKQWHMEKNDDHYTWITLDTTAGLLRSGKGWMGYGGIFAYYGNGNRNNTRDMPARYNKTWASRAVIVVGTGI